ncbi:sensor histidine kinase [Haloglomus salinum]|jgi:signal transduction histidine kinase|uniref:sensor histidine kinase n=1 Tax=Haloglomus salinum TaxID=2962673 RepID=UPI0020C9BAEA|nr:HAMP domain-containing sensor histidine kinase [Haloglomus salinum]
MSVGRIREAVERGGGSWFVSGIGVVLAGLSLWYVIVFRALSITSSAVGSPGFVLAVLEVILLGGFSVVLVYAGYWLATSQFDSQQLWWAGLWTVVGLAGIVAIVALLQSSQLSEGQALSEVTIVEELLLAAGGGGIAGLLIGISTVQSMWSQEQVERQRDTLEFVNELLRHNVLNGMQVVLASAELVEEELDSEDPDHETVESALSHIDDRGEDIVELVENVRVLAQSVSGDVACGPVVVSSLLTQKAGTARGTYPEATIRTDIEPDVTVSADDLLPAVFENLLANAVDHNDREHPTVEVALETDPDEGVAVVTVADDGPGIPDEYKEAYFGPGEQDEGSVGQGLGLYLVDTLVDRYGGAVTATDNEPRGARFEVELPLHED